MPSATVPDSHHNPSTTPTRSAALRTVQPSVVTRLRDLTPVRALSRAEMMHVGERQAALLLELARVDRPPVPETIISDLPRIQLHRFAPIGVAGFTHWSSGRWLIVLRDQDRPSRQRFTLAHEFKHILDHPFISVMYPDANGMPSHQRAEEACNYFAASLLMPRGWLRQAWHHGPQDITYLARRFNVSRSAMTIRLSHVGLADTHLHGTR